MELSEIIERNLSWLEQSHRVCGIGRDANFSVSFDSELNRVVIRGEDGHLLVSAGVVTKLAGALNALDSVLFSLGLAT